MTTLLFVHGTGVRGTSYDLSFAAIKAQAARHLPGVEVRACPWGDEVGARLNQQGASVPGYDIDKSNAAAVRRASNSKEQDVRWGLLYDDPLYELRSYAALGATDELQGSNRAPNAKSPGQEAITQLRLLDPSNGALARSGHLAVQLTPSALALLSKGGLFEGALASPLLTDKARARPVIARAFVAAWAVAARTSGLPTLDGELRDALYNDAVRALGGATAGIKDEFIGVLTGLASRIATPMMRKRRTAVSDGALAPAGDILLYQTPHGGKEIRDHIEKHIASCTAPVYVLAHSLGGIACFELLVLKALGIAGLVTCGSQAPFFYESDALGALRYGAALPEHFPARWLNVYDLNDMLSYVAEGVFPQRVVDLEVQSRQPFPHSHSAYWTNEQLWTAMKDFVT